MKKKLKIISIMLIILILNFGVLVNSVKAVEAEQVKIYAKGEFKRVIRYNGIVVKTTEAVYEKDGKEYPAYCLNKDVPGVGEIESYNVTKQGKLTDLGLWKVIINGYPYKTLEQLGVVDEDEAYIATKQAVYCYIYNRGTENYAAIGESGIRVINAINLILTNAKNSTENYEKQDIEIIQSEEWQIDSQDKQFISKQYEVKSSINISKFLISLENHIEGTQITDLKNQEKNEFNSNEKFKILIPISSLKNTGNFKIKIQTELETKPVFFGKAPSNDVQDYALTAFTYEDINTEIMQNYETNETQIIIEKQDAETGEKLTGAKFEILNEVQQSIAIIETNEQGKINLQQILPGKYFVKEIKAPDGYELNSEIFEIQINLNEKKKIEIKNTKIEVPEEPEDIEEPEAPPVEEEQVIEEKPVIEELPEIEEEPVVEIPKLPVTGM